VNDDLFKPLNNPSVAVTGIGPGRRHLTSVALVAVLTASAVAVETGMFGPGSIDWRAVVNVHLFVLRHPAVADVSRVVTGFGSPWIVDAIAALAAIMLWWRGRAGDALFVAAVRVITLLTDVVLKESIRRPRPVLPHPLAHAHSFSFPSGHSSGAASVYLPLAVVLVSLLHGLPSRVVVAAASLLCLAVAASRVSLGLHYPSDVVAGVALGALVTCLLTPLRTWRAPPPRGHSRGSQPTRPTSSA
jgi:undecaprenyl-diphosphatase